MLYSRLCDSFHQLSNGRLHMQDIAIGFGFLVSRFKYLIYRTRYVQNIYLYVSNSQYDVTVHAF
jgi:hypothetical protein